MISEFEASQRIPVYLFDGTAGSACRNDPQDDAEEDLISLPRVGDDYPQASVNSETSPATLELVVNESDSQTLAVGQEFSGAKAFRDALVAAAIANKFELTFIRSDRARVTAKCAADGCSWRIHASKLPEVDTFQIKTLKGVHCCVLPERSGHRQANMKWILNCIMDRVRENINYKPKEIMKDIEQDYGVIIPYLKAHRAKELALELIYGMPMKDIVFNQAEVQGVEKALHDVLDHCRKKSLKGSPVHCNLCKKAGHNRRSCMKSSQTQIQAQNLREKNFHCMICKQNGHNRRTCQSKLMEQNQQMWMN
ncbi:hypothetical protein ABKV19_011522 [Rosa sericea]